MSVLTKEQKERADAAIVGGLVADAASAGLHWIYDTSKIDELLAGGKPIEFYDPPSCPFYQSTVGNLSPWGHELVPLLKTMSGQGAFHAKVPGDLDVESFGRECLHYYKTASNIPYTNGAIREFISNSEAGVPLADCAKVDSQAHSVNKTPILVARYAGTPQLLEKVEEATLVHQKGREGVAWGKAGAKILEKVVENGSVKGALDWAAEAEPEALGLTSNEDALLKKALGSDERPFREVAKENGLSCNLPGAFLNAVIALRRYGADGYVTAVRENSKLGGDNCSRAIFIGACLAAEIGIAAVPEEWREKTSMLPDLQPDIDIIALGLKAI